MKKIFLLLFLLAFYGLNYAQITISIPDTTISNTSDTLKIPLKVTNFNNIGAISLKIFFHASAMSYSSSEIEINHGYFLSNSNNDSIYISWFDPNPANVGNGTLCYLVFTGIKSSSSIQFITSGCEIADENGTALNVNYKNGSVTANLGQLAMLAGNVWHDSNHNGIKDNGEKGVQWITVDLWKINSNDQAQWKAWHITDSLGDFYFTDLQPGKYYVDYILIGYDTNYTFVTEGVGSDSTINSHAIAITDTTAKTGIIDLSSGENYNWANAGLVFKNATSVNGWQSNQNNSSLPDEFNLKQNYPNPFNPTTAITYDVPIGSYVSLKVYDILGKEIATLVNGYRSAGEYKVTFNMNNAGTNLSSGIYLYRLVSGNHIFTKKMMLLK